MREKKQMVVELRDDEAKVQEHKKFRTRPSRSSSTVELRAPSFVRRLLFDCCKGCLSTLHSQAQLAGFTHRLPSSCHSHLHWCSICSRIFHGFCLCALVHLHASELSSFNHDHDLNHLRRCLESVQAEHYCVQLSSPAEHALLA